MGDYEWYAATSIDQAKDLYDSVVGDDEAILDEEIHQLNESDLDRLTIHMEDHPGVFVERTFREVRNTMLAEGVEVPFVLASTIE